MFAAARVMAAGKAGLESLPYFVDELLAEGITQLAPWAADHDGGAINDLNSRIQDFQTSAWRQIYPIDAFNTRIGIPLTPDTAPSQRLLHRINRFAAESTALADHPAVLGAWCRRNIWQFCRETMNLWDRFKYERGLTREQQLAVIIPYCPEGPTSGTVGMYLGAALRKCFSDRHRADELVVWGIELCPPVNTDETGMLDAIAMRNVFRGYAAREELLNKEGLPLS